MTKSLTLKGKEMWTSWFNKSYRKGHRKKLMGY